MNLINFDKFYKYIFKLDQKKSATERTFQGILISLINQILSANTNIGFLKITQEENVGVDNNRFSDGILYSLKDSTKYLKN